MQRSSFAARPAPSLQWHTADQNGVVWLKSKMAAVVDIAVTPRFLALKASIVHESRRNYDSKHFDFFRIKWTRDSSNRLGYPCKGENRIKIDYFIHILQK